MKDIEKIKSEDLGCQVADANPGNFAIEQEVGAMVGATVPAPTEPSADDARELGAQLLVFLRRALTPIKSALRTALADIYAHLDSRCTDYTPAAYAPYSATRRAYDPMGSLPARSVANLLTAITAFSARKISNGSAPNDGIKDGTSLAHILLGSDMTSSVTEIKDDNYNWSLVTNPSITRFVNLVKASINGEGVIRNSFANASNIALKEVSLTGVEELRRVYAGRDAPFFRCPELEVVYAPDATRLVSEGSDDGIISECPKMKRVVIGTPTSLNRLLRGDMPDIIDVEIGAGTSINLNISEWNPTNVLADADKTATFLQNFLEHICKNLANRTGQTKLTLTLSADVYTAIMTDNDIKAELVARNWKVTDGTNNYNN